MDLGLGPIITSGMLMHYLTKTRTIEVNMRNRETRELYQSALKIITICVAFVEALIYLFQGVYGPV